MIFNFNYIAYINRKNLLLQEEFMKNILSREDKKVKQSGNLE